MTTLSLPEVMKVLESFLKNHPTEYQQCLDTVESDRKKKRDQKLENIKQNLERFPKWQVPLRQIFECCGGRMYDVFNVTDAAIVPGWDNKDAQELFAPALKEDKNFPIPLCTKTEITVTFERNVWREQCSILSLGDMIHEAKAAFSLVQQDGKTTQIVHQLSRNEIAVIISVFDIQVPKKKEWKAERMIDERVVECCTEKFAGTLWLHSDRDKLQRYLKDHFSGESLSSTKKFEGQ